VTRETETEPAEAEVVAELLQELLRRTHLSAPSDLGAVVADQAGRIGARDVSIHLIDYEQGVLAQLFPEEGAGAELSVAGTVAGRAFSATNILRATTDEPGQQRLWLPLLDGTERLGVMGMSFADDRLSPAIVATCERYAHLVAMLIVTKQAFGDAIEVVRRRTPMSLASELAWGLAPPLVFATDDVTVAGLLEPAYDNGGDAFDYAMNGQTLHLGIFDAMGHGLAAAGVAAFALSGYRHSRRAGHDLLETFAAMDAAVGTQFPERRFVTALIAQLEIDSGRLSWVSAGHPPPLLIRNGRRARPLATEPAAPLGVDLGGAQPVVSHESLEPGDLVLLYTDGLTDARSPEGNRFTLEDVSGYIEREVAAGQTAPETLRRIRHSLLGREGVDLRDDATALLVEWRSGAEARLMPQTVL